MDWPKCRLCEEKHDPKGEHVFPTESAPGEPAKANKPKGVVNKPKERLKTSFDRVGYQREYMRVWRALKAHRADPWPKGV